VFPARLEFYIALLSGIILTVQGHQKNWNPLGMNERKPSQNAPKMEAVLPSEMLLRRYQFPTLHGLTYQTTAIRMSCYWNLNSVIFCLKIAKNMHHILNDSKVLTDSVHNPICFGCGHSIFQSYLEAIQPCRLQSTPLYSVCTAASVSSMF
jgi:hypothetical protein